MAVAWQTCAVPRRVAESDSLQKELIKPSIHYVVCKRLGMVLSTAIRLASSKLGAATKSLAPPVEVGRLHEVNLCHLGAGRVVYLEDMRRRRRDSRCTS